LKAELHSLLKMIVLIDSENMASKLPALLVSPRLQRASISD
jgi:hypothetical protein